MATETPQDPHAPSSTDSIPSNPFKFNTKHYDEIINMDLEAYESLSESHQEYVTNYLELYDTLTTGGANKPFEYPHPDFPSHMSGYPNDPPPMPPPHSMPPPMHCSCRGHPNHPPPARPVPISSFKLTVPTALTNHSLHVEVEKFNLTIPFPGPHKPHKILTKLSVNKHPLFLFDLVGLNGAVHATYRLLDPRGRHPRHPGRDFMDEEESLWEDWEEWLPQWAANN
jgi:hypothetical protein